MSSLSDIRNNLAYQKIIAMGVPVVRKILVRMQSRPGFWFYALRQLTKDIDPIDPVHPGMYGDLRKMTTAWLKWGAAHGYITPDSKA